jgi:signal transduction histidine kinase
MMTLSEQRKLFFDLVDTKPACFAQNLADRPGDVRNNLDSLRQSNENLRSQLAVLQARNNELEAYAHTVAHAIKNPLSAIILSSDAIAEITGFYPGNPVHRLRDERSDRQSPAPLGAAQSG